MNKIDMKDIQEQVNQFDKSFGIKLSKINPNNEPEMIFDQGIIALANYMMNVVYAINGIKKRKTPSGSLKSIKPNAFKSQSILNWTDDKTTYDPSSNIFRCRFLTIYLLLMTNRLEKIVKNQYKLLSKNKTGLYENGYFYLQSLSNDIQTFIKLILSGVRCPNMMMKINYICSFGNNVNRFDPIMLQKYSQTAKKELQIGLRHRFLTKDEFPEDIGIHYVLQLSYMLSTGDDKLKHALPKFKYIEGATTDYELRKLIESLGMSIMDNRKYYKRPILYQAFMDANPTIYSNYEDINRNRYLSVGVRAIAYADYFCGDKSLHKFMSKMTHRTNENGLLFKWKVNRSY